MDLTQDFSGMSGLSMAGMTRPGVADKVFAFNRMIHGGETDTLSERLFSRYPGMKPEYWIACENEQGEIIASLCLIPTVWNCRGVAIRCAEMGIVGTREDFRGRGISRSLIAAFKRLAAAEGFDLCAVAGIAYVYTREGFEYAVPLENDIALGLDALDDQPDTFEYIHAMLDDADVLSRWYDDTMGKRDIFAVRTPRTWEYLLGPACDTETAVDRFLISRDGRVEGYVGIARGGFGDGLIVQEVASGEYDAHLSALRFARRLAVERNKPRIRLNLGVSSPCARIARALGGIHRFSCAWQLFVPDHLALLTKMRPVLEQNLTSGAFGGYSGSLTVRYIHGSVTIVMDHGSVTVEPTASARGNDLSIALPPTMFTRLVFGSGPMAAIQKACPNISVQPFEYAFLDELFPPVDGYCHSAI